MKSFISSVCINTNSASSEKICIGLIAVTELKVYFAKSDKKLNIAVSLFKEKIVTAIKNSLSLIEKNVNEFNEQAKSNKLFVQNFFTSEYFNYLKEYSQGVIQYAEPKHYSGNISEKEFNELFGLFVGEELKPKEIKQKSISIKSSFHQLLKSKEIYKKVDVEYKIPANKIPSVYSPISIDLIGKNGSILTANAIDFAASPDTIIGNLEEYTTLIFGLEKLSENLNLEGTFNNLVAEAPEKNSEQYDIYYSITNDKYSPFKFVKLNQLGEIEKKISSAPFTKFSEFIQKI